MHTHNNLTFLLLARKVSNAHLVIVTLVASPPSMAFLKRH